MIQDNVHFILNVDSTSYITNLVKLIFRKSNKVEVTHAKNPEEAKKLVLSNTPYSVIISENDFENGSDSGKDFFEFCRDTTPSSSRIYCSGVYSNNEYVPLIEEGEINSYVDKSDGLINDSLLSATVIGIEYHKTNLLGEYLNILDIKSMDSVSDSLGRLDEIKGKFEYELKSIDSKVNFEGREMEINQLFHTSDTLANRALVATEKIEELANGEDGVDSLVKKRVIQTLEHICHIHKYLLQSRLHLLRRTDRINKGLEQIEKVLKMTAKTDDFIKRLRGGF